MIKFTKNNVPRPWNLRRYKVAELEINRLKN